MPFGGVNLMKRLLFCVLLFIIILPISLSLASDGVIQGDEELFFQLGLPKNSETGGFFEGAYVYDYLAVSPITESTFSWSVYSTDGGPNILLNSSTRDEYTRSAWLSTNPEERYVEGTKYHYTIIASHNGENKK